MYMPEGAAFWRRLPTYMPEGAAENFGPIALFLQRIFSSGKGKQKSEI